MEKNMTYYSSENLYDILLRRFKRILFFKLTKKSPPLFLRGKDIISYASLVEGVHEESITNMIKYYAKNGLSDFFIDVGANIGLTSCQNGPDFKRVVCFEPNPLCVNILKTNLAISLTKGKFSINEFGLGDSDGNFDLFIPRHNWGGAFVRSNANSYTDDVLASKDGFSKIDLDNYIVEQVEVKQAKEVFLELFSSLKKDGFKKGVIKIDVEGFESIVLEGIGKAIPSEMSAMIVFENWDSKFNFAEIRNHFSDRQIKLKKLECSILDSKMSKFVKKLSLLFRADKSHLVSIDDATSTTGNIVIEVF